jgi:hypothetical protein
LIARGDSAKRAFHQTVDADTPTAPVASAVMRNSLPSSPPGWTSPRDELPPSGVPVLVAAGAPLSYRVAQFNIADPADLRALEQVVLWLRIPPPPVVAQESMAETVWDQVLGTSS